jgi:hypothetical protein
MKAMLTNWKTTSAGVAAILTALADMATGLSHGTISGNLTVDIAGIVTGIGLLYAADSK